MFRSFACMATIFIIAGPTEAQDRDLGLAVRNNIAAMTVELEPKYAGKKQPGSNGVLSGAAVKRLEAGTPKALLPFSFSAENAAGGQQQTATSSTPR